MFVLSVFVFSWFRVALQNQKFSGVNAFSGVPERGLIETSVKRIV